MPYVPSMDATVQYPHVQQEEGRSPSLARWPRIRVSQIVMDHLGRGWAAEEIARQYPHLELAEIHSALAYYFDHREEIDGEIRTELRQADLAARVAGVSPLAIKLASLAHP